jgi:hypothetical protein
LNRSSLRRAAAALSWTTIWPGLVWVVALGADGSMPVLTGAPIVLSLALDLVRAAGWANRLGFGIKLRQERDGWSWPLGPAAETTAELVAGASLLVSMRWLVPPLVVPRGTSFPLWAFLGALAAACGITVVVFALVRGRRRSSVRLTDRRVLIERVRFGTALERTDIERLRLRTSDARVEVIADVRGRGAIHLLILPSGWTTAARVRTFAAALGARLGLPVVDDVILN